MTVGRVVSLHSYPIKGLTGVSHTSVPMQAGHGFPNDRIFGFAKGNSGFDPGNPMPLPKDRFIVLLEHAGLAGLKTHINTETMRLTVNDAHHFDLGSDAGQAAASSFLVDLLGLTKEEAPFFAQAHPHRFTDVSVTSPQMMQAVSLINMGSVRDLADRAGCTVDPARFRGNVLIDGWPAFFERDLIGQQITIGDVAFNVLKNTRRCGATRVNPDTATRDLDVLALLKTHYGHLDLGVYLECAGSGAVSCGDPVAVAHSG